MGTLWHWRHSNGNAHLWLWRLFTASCMICDGVGNLNRKAVLRPAGTCVTWVARPHACIYSQSKLSFIFNYTDVFGLLFSAGPLNITQFWILSIIFFFYYNTMFRGLDLSASSGGSNKCCWSLSPNNKNRIHSLKLLVFNKRQDDE
jgi:hypothetical protein